MSARPPSSPVAAHTSTVSKRFGMESDCGIGEASVEVVDISDANFSSMVWTMSRGKNSSITQSLSTRIFRSRPGNFPK